MSTNVNTAYIRQYDYSGTILRVDRDKARLLANYEALIEFRDDALEGGILEQAQRQANLVFGNVVQVLTGGNVVIVFRDTETPLPDSCQPVAPENWIYDAEDDVWEEIR